MEKYKTQYDDIAEEYANMTTIMKKCVILPTFEKLLGNIKNKRIIDLACGYGFFTRFLAKKNPKEIIGVDISEKEIDMARNKEVKEGLGIQYLCEDVLKLKINEKFDIVTAVYLLNYAKTESELEQMFNIIYNLLDKNGEFYAITTHPNQQPNQEFKYDRKIVGLHGQNKFKNGDKLIVQLNEEGTVKFSCYFWDKQTYENAIKKAGFESFRWFEPVISGEGIKKYGKEYWENFKRNPSVIGVICKK